LPCFILLAQKQFSLFAGMWMWPAEAAAQHKVTTFAPTKVSCGGNLCAGLSRYDGNVFGCYNRVVSTLDYKNFAASEFLRPEDVPGFTGLHNSDFGVITVDTNRIWDVVHREVVFLIE
jgi:hypothetical protein